MNTMKIGTFPGKLNEFVLEDGTTVREALQLAGLELGAEQDIKLDGNVASIDDVIDGSSMLLLTKRIKGASTMKVGTFPGRLEEYMFEEGTTVREALEIAGLTLGAEQDIKIDGNVASLDDTVDGASMLLLTKRIKGAR